MVGFQISSPLSNEFTVGISQKDPGHVPADPAPSRMSAPAQNARPAPVTIPTHAVFVVAELFPRRVQVLTQFAVDRVEHLGSVVGDRRDVSVALVEHGAGHESVSLVEAATRRRPVGSLRDVRPSVRRTRR